MANEGGMAKLEGTFAATGNSADFVPNPGKFNNACQFNVHIYGTFVGTVVLLRSFDGTNYVPVLRYCSSTAVSYTTPSSEVLPEPEGGAIYRLSCTAYTSGTVNYRLSA
jgi:hypothetical protein